MKVKKCQICEDGWWEDGNARGHAGSKFYPCSCDDGLDIIIRAVKENDRDYGNPLGVAIECLRSQLAQRDKELAKAKEEVDTYKRLVDIADENYGSEIAGAREKNERLREATAELLEVGDLRGDTELPHPANDPALWTVRMQTAWDELRKAAEAGKNAE